MKTKYIHLLDKSTLLDYLIVIKKMPFAREISIARYAELDKQRRLMHEKILLQLNIDRNNEEFAIELAMYCEELLIKE